MIRMVSGSPARHDGAVAADLMPFLTLHFRGARFDGEHGMPVETLGELVAYRDLVAEVARSVFLDQNRQRQRVPKGFSDRFRLRIREINEGSAVPTLERPIPDGKLPIDDEFDIARDLISVAIHAVANHGPVPADFPHGALVHFNRLGQGLRDDESIELQTPGTSTGPLYTQRTRKALLVGRSSYQRDAHVLGWVTELDAERMRFHLRRPDGSVVPAPIDVVTFEEVKEALAPTGEGPQVSVSGVGVFDRSDNLVRFDSVHELVSEEADDAVAEAVAGSTMSAEWLDGDGTATDPEVILRAKVLLESILDRGAPPPRVFPVSDGGLQAEWTIGDREISVAVEPGGSLYVISVNVASGESQDLTLGEDDAEQVLRLVLPDAS